MVEIQETEYRKLQEAREIAESTLDAVREPLIILDGELRVVSASLCFYRTFNVKVGETEKQYIYDLGNRQWDIPKLRHLLEGILPNNESFYDYEVEHNFPTIGRRIMLLNARRIPRPPAKPRVILLAIEDITDSRQIAERKLAGERLNDKVNELKVVNDAALGRELRLIELEEEVDSLLLKLGLPPKYKT